MKHHDPDRLALDPDDPNVSDNIRVLANALIVPDGGQRDWVASAQHLLRSVMASLFLTERLTTADEAERAGL